MRGQRVHSVSVHVTKYHLIGIVPVRDGLNEGQHHMAIKINGAISADVAENTETEFVIGKLTAEGAETATTVTYELDELSDLFEIFHNQAAGEWQLRVKAGADYEIASQHTLKITVTIDGTESAPEAITINVTNVNEAPTGLSLSGTTVVENSAAGTEIGVFSAMDPDLNDTFTFSLVEGGGGAFKIEGGKLVVADASKLDFEKSSSYQIKVRATDADKLWFEKVISIGVTDGVDTFTGTARNDKIVGTMGDDRINGGAGKDKLTGLDGKDTFVFNSPVKKGAFDQIIDFKPVDDTLEISLSAIKSLKIKGLKEGKLNKKFFEVGSPDDSNDYVYYNKKNGFVYLDSDGEGGKKGIEILKVKPGTSLTADDFLFV
jgi:serralysin